MKLILFVHAVLAVLGAFALLFLNGKTASMSFAVGSGISLGNLLVLTQTWPRILAKKQVALAVGVIVFKFAILGWIIYEVATSTVFSLGWVAAGLALVLPSILASSFSASQTSTEKAESF
jgi:hypothetical protein